MRVTLQGNVYEVITQINEGTYGKIYVAK